MTFPSGYPESSSGRKPSACCLNMRRPPGGSLSPGVRPLTAGRWSSGTWKTPSAGCGRTTQPPKRTIWIAWSICGSSVAPTYRPRLRTPWKASAVRSTTSPWSTSNASERSTLPSSRKTTSQRRWRPQRWSPAWCTATQCAWPCLHPPTYHLRLPPNPL
ncbi:PDX1 C-terminal inhibiting factor 1 [Rhinolophus ferrumequinum]|uniref:PDX1 C-terminal inhibiting factor 1 n=1 Tax=Rhinolophus ferrumequinum TaxID=59479 RepID=A0A7J7S8F1_RHIFE|nr:PDX1 C-terminal inhibiting factor 1 [Rhinolophus ferrumequinum]